MGAKKLLVLNFQTDYVVNSRLNLKMFYDKVITNPFITTTYPGGCITNGF